MKTMHLANEAIAEARRLPVRAVLCALFAASCALAANCAPVAFKDAARSIPSSVFTMIDLQYTFMLQSFGLVRSNTLKESVYRRPSYYAMQNVYAIFDDDTRALGHETAKSGGRDLTCCRFSRLGHDWRLYWFSEAQPSSDLEFARIDDVPLRPHAQSLRKDEK